MGSMLPFTHMCYSSFQSQNRFHCSKKEKDLTSFKAVIFWPCDTSISCLACLLPFYLLCFSSWWLLLCLVMCVQQMKNITQFIAFIYYSPASLYFKKYIGMLFTAGNKRIYAFIKHYAACTHILYDCNEPIPRNQQVNPRLHLPWPPGTELRFLLHWAAERASFGRSQCHSLAFIRSAWQRTWWKCEINSIWYTNKSSGPQTAFLWEISALPSFPPLACKFPITLKPEMMQS